MDAIRVGDAMDDASGQYPSFIINDCGQGGWSSPMQHDGRHLRETRVTNMGSGSRFALLLPYDDFKHPSYEASIAITYRDSSIVEHKVEINAGTAGLKTIGVFEHTGDGIWKTLRLPIPRWIYATNIQAELSQNIGTTETEEPAPSGDTSSVPPNKRFGTGQVRIDHIRFLDAMGNEQLVLQHGKPATLEITFHAEDTSLVGSTMMCSVGFLSHDGLEIAAIQSLGDGIMFTISLSGKIRMVIDNLLLCNRGYRISVGLFSQMDLNGYNPHFTVSPFLYDLLARSYDIAVEGAYMAENWIFRPPVRWEADGLVSSSEG
ncbi:MAG: Wzt carbohydrate-binding domain-containing protein [Vicinamibacteria bacterium]|nr:Wzt carbohydrate-binding domain-containing protein [Vicinamibacteria bacterium]